MANATFEALTGDPVSRSRSDTGAESRKRHRGVAASRVSGVRAAGPALDELRHWLASCNTLLEGPLDVQHAGGAILEILDRFVPSRQSALLLAVEEGDMLHVGAARGAKMTLSQATWVEQTARESLARAQVLGRELPDSVLSSFLWVPVLFEGRRVGVIELGDSGGRWLADAGARELSVLADEVGRLLVGIEKFEVRDASVEALERSFEASSRECREQRRLLSVSSSRDAIAGFTIRIAERAVDPSTYVLSNLQSAREDVASIQRVVERFVAATDELIESLDDDPQTDGAKLREAPEFRALQDALESAKDSEFQSCFGELGPLIDDVEHGAQALRAIGEDLRELALGDSAPMDWVDVSQLVEQALNVVAQREGQRLDVEVRVEEVPPIHCQRLRIVTLLVSLLDHVVGKATPESSVGIQVELRGGNAVIELFVEGVNLSSEDANTDVFGTSSEIQRFHRDIAEDHGGQLETEQFDDLARMRLSIPTDRN